MNLAQHLQKLLGQLIDGGATLPIRWEMTTGDGGRTSGVCRIGEEPDELVIDVQVAEGISENSDGPMDLIFTDANGQRTRGRIQDPGALH